MKIESLRPSSFQHISPFTGFATIALALSTMTLGACGEPPPPPMPSEMEFSLEVFIYDQNDVPVPRIPVLVDGQTVGYSDKNGSFTARILEAPDTPIELSLGKTNGYRFMNDNAIRETLTAKPGIDGNFVGLPITLRSTVSSLQNSYLVWVELSCDDSLKEDACANIPLKLDGKVVATTNSEGKSHFAFDGIMGTTAIVTVDTPVYKKDSDYYAVFDPKQPTFELQLGSDNTVFVIEESFTDLIALHTERVAEKTKVPVRRRPAATKKAAPKKAAPKKAAPKKAPAKKAEPKNSIIDLW